MSSQLVSVVIAAHDNWPDLELAVRSALHQSYPMIEVIVVDNGSNDATAAEVPRLFGNSVRYIRQENRGDAGAYNTGRRVAAGAFVQFLDGDDFLAPDKIQKQLAMFIEDEAAEIVYGDARQFQGPPGPAAFTDIDTQEYPDILAAMLAPGGHGAGLMVQGALFRAATLDRVGAFDEALYVADVEYFLRAARMRCRFRYCPGSWWFYRRRPGQMSADGAAIARGLEDAWTKALGYIDEEPYRSTLLSHLARFRWHQAVVGERGGRRERLALLSQAQEPASHGVSRGSYIAGVFLVMLPFGRFWLRSPALAPLRRRVARAFKLV
jgi:glycosyltransferase involved in cell wall biosynthesis